MEIASQYRCVIREVIKNMAVGILAFPNQRYDVLL